MNREEIRQQLFAMQDTDYREFQVKLIPTVDPEKVIGVRTPQLRKFAKELSRDPNAERFLEDLPHEYFDENQLHAFLISDMKDFDSCILKTERFLPQIDNWATCDQLSPKVFKKHRPELLKYIKRWIRSEHTYIIRFAVGMLMQHFLDEDYSEEYPELVSSVRSEEYYVNMMIAWYFATALAKQYDSVLPFIESGRLDPWTHNKAIQKAAESFRITPEQKTYLRTLKRKAPK